MFAVDAGYVVEVVSRVFDRESIAKFIAGAKPAETSYEPIIIIATDYLHD